MSIQVIQQYRISKEHDRNERCKFLTQVPDEIMELILQRLTILEYLAFRQVCAPLRALSKGYRPASQLPWLLFNSLPFYIQDHGFVSCGRTRSSHTRKLFYQSNCLGSVEGWMIMAARIHISSPDVNLLLLNPLTRSRLELPTQSTIPGFLNDRIDFIMKAVASFAQPRVEHCLVACLCVDDRLAFCRPIDESWTLVGDREGNRFARFLDVEIIDGKIYAATFYNKSIMVFNIQGVTYTAQRLVMLLNNIRGEFHLAKDVASKDLFGVYQSLNVCKTRYFEVFKLIRNEGDDPHWVPVYDLGDRTLFISDLGTKIISSSSNLGGSDDNRLERNCIYYVLSLKGSTKCKIEFGVFSWKNQRIGFSALQYLPKGSLRARVFWFTPNPW